MQKTVSVEGVDYTLNTMTAGDALDIQESFGDSQANSATTRLWSFKIVAASLGKTIDELRSIPWTHYQELIAPALEVNGFKTRDDTLGESRAGASLAG